MRGFGRLVSSLRTGFVLVLLPFVAWAQAPAASGQQPAAPATGAAAAAQATAKSGTSTRKKKAKKRDARPRTLVDALDEKVPLDVGIQLRIFKQARARKAEIDRMEGELDRRSARLKSLMKDVEKRYKTLRMVQEELKAMNDAGDQRPEEVAAKENQELEKKKQERIAKISKVFNKMKADDAAKMIPAMEEELVVDVMRRLKPKQAAKILGKIKPDKAARLTGKMAAAKREKKRKAR